MFVKKSMLVLFSVLIMLVLLTGTASARPLADTLGSSFTYQGRLMDGGSPANGSYDFQFSLYNAASSGTQVGSTLTQTGVTVANGLFTVQLDFGYVFTGTALYLQVAVRPGGSSGSYTPLTPLQAISSTLYAQLALAAVNASTVTNGLYSNGAYYDPEWLKSLASTKITGPVADANTVGGLPASAFASAIHNHWGENWSGTGPGLSLTSLNNFTGLSATGAPGVVALSNEVGIPGLEAGAYSSIDIAAYFGGNVAITGNLTVTGSKSAVVETKDYGTRTLYAVESPQNWFEDFGSGQLTDGTAVIPIDPVYAETVNLTEDYHVFLTPDGDCALFVDAKTPTSFTVKAIGGQTCSIPFDYRIDAKRLGYEDVRLAPFNPPAIPDAPTK